MSKKVLKVKCRRGINRKLQKKLDKIQHFAEIEVLNKRVLDHTLGD